MSLRQIIKINNITAAAFLVLLVASLLTLSLIVGALFYAQNALLKKGSGYAPREKTMEEIIKDLTAPAGSGEKSAVSGETLDSLTAPEKSGSGAKAANQGVSKEVMDSLTAPAVK